MKKINKRKRLVFELTVSGLSAALVLIMLALAVYSPVAKLSFYVLASICLLLPCIANSLWGLCMAFIAGGSLAILFNPIGVLPFALFFGLQIILNYLSRKYLGKKWFISIPIKLIILEVGIFGIYKLYGISSIENIFNSLGWNYNYWFVMLITLPLILIYDYAIGMIWRFLDRRLNKIVTKYTDKVKKIETQVEQNQSTDITPTEQKSVDLFDDFLDNDNNIDDNVGGENNDNSNDDNDNSDNEI